MRSLPHAGGSLPPSSRLLGLDSPRSLIDGCFEQGMQSKSLLVQMLDGITCDLHRALGRLLAREAARGTRLQKRNQAIYQASWSLG